jgi:hypothetical protein
MSFDKFVSEVRDLCEGTAQEKGYNSTGVDGQNDLYQFIQNLSGGDGHALGEIVYKAVRYSRKKDKHDLVKIAAWAYLIYRYGATLPGTFVPLTASEFNKLNQRP